MKPESAEKFLTVLFRLNAVLLTSAVFAIFLPNAWMQTVHGWLGMGELPQQPITEYLARSCSMLYALHGTILLVVSMNLRKYWDLVPVLIALHLALGITVLVIDLKAGMPWYWTAGEGPGIVVFALVLYWLWKNANSAPHST